MCCACKCKFGPLSILNWREGVLKGTVLHLPSMKNSHLVIDHHVIQIENFASYHVRRVVWFSSYNWMLVAFMRRSCKVTRFLMLWYLSKMSLHLETLLPLRLSGELYVASNLTQMASTRGLASTWVAGPEFPPTIALKNIYSNSCQHLKERDIKWKEKVIFTFSNELATCSVGNITRFSWQVTHSSMPPILALSPPKKYSNDTKKSQHKFD